MQSLTDAWITRQLSNLDTCRGAVVQRLEVDRHDVFGRELGEAPDLGNRHENRIANVELGSSRVNDGHRWSLLLERLYHVRAEYRVAAEVQGRLTGQLDDEPHTAAHHAPDKASSMPCSDRPNRAGEKTRRSISDPNGMQPIGDQCRNIALLTIDRDSPVSKKRSARSIQVIEVTVSKVRDEAGVDIGQEGASVGGKVHKRIALGWISYDGQGRQTASGREHRIHQNTDADDIQYERRVSKQRQLQSLTSTLLGNAAQRSRDEPRRSCGVGSIALLDGARLTPSFRDQDSP